MAAFAVICIDKENSLTLRADTRETHLAYLRARPEVVRLAGPFMDAAGQSVGSLLLIEVEDQAAAEAFAAADPYAQAGLFASVEVKPWRAVIGQLP
ncbi:hypothetical protein C5708_06410 [Caulobacter sp. CCUG 60055]|uniref:YciI family protein n=1 Tax=Caulobacter sp. CCUG 60055 TaxID=2100090 RepID=UPI001FA6E99A|nr:YciI family protein [Caulobacter sp. CCUG 60055]MBQ1543217.1 YciI family protein [Caulobacteraceae bacterium]MCI3179885.1 hypothetical protein [Caulobacter sp. CCUG 60055]